MRVATLDDWSSFFLDDLAWQHLQSWASGEVTGFGARRVVARTGPIMAGKTALLELLPRFLAPDSLRKPVVLACSFKAGEGPQQAALRLAHAAAALAAEVGCRTVGLSETGGPADIGMPRAMGKLAADIAAGGGELILLLDEVQAPLLAAESAAQATEYAILLQEVVSMVRGTSRVAITGGSLVALLSHVRLLQRDYALWETMTRVHVGATPTEPAAAAIADAIVRARSKHWPQAIAAAVTPDLVLGALSAPQAAGRATTAAEAPPPLPQPPARWAPRPALVARLADQIASAAGAADMSGSSLDLLAQAAVAELGDTLLEAARVDTAAAQLMLHWLPRNTIWRRTSWTAPR